MRVLVIGYGYVGSALAQRLVQLGHAVTAIRRNECSDSAPGIRVLAVDIADQRSLARITPEFDWVVNCVSSGFGGSQSYRETYYKGTSNLLNWLHSQPPLRFVYTSSTGVYGQDDGSLVDEDSPTEPGSDTGRVLVETERLLFDAHEQRALKAVVLRLAGIYGPGRGYWLKQFLSGEARVEGAGERYVNMIHRDDVVGLILAVLQNPSPALVYNAVDEEPVTQLNLFRWLAGKLNRPMPSAVPLAAARDRKRAATNKRVSSMRARSQLGYRFRYPSFREGFAALLHEREVPGPHQVSAE